MIDMEWLTILAIVLGPFLGIWVHGKLEVRKTIYQRKLDIFKILMATRATPLARAHVESLNRIDIEFTGRKEENIREAWAVLLDHYGQCPQPPIKPSLDWIEVEQDKYNSESQSYDNAFGRWNDKTIEFRARLLKEMSRIFGYQFDEVKIRQAIYYPKLHGDIDDRQLSLLEAATDVVWGKRPLGMHIVNWPNETEPDG